jgi:hypothetical protein
MHYIIGLGMAFYFTYQNNEMVRKYNNDIENEHQTQMKRIQNEHQTQMRKLNERCEKLRKSSH